MPYVNLVKNKEIPNERVKYSLLGVHGDTSHDAIMDYCNSNEILKILVTYDSLPRIIDMLSNLGYDVYKDFFLLIDEYHVLSNSYSFRHKPIKRLLEYAPNFERVTYMSATPIEKEFVLDELKDLPTISVE